ncbi:MAG: ABC transporter permease subunit [Glaciecola sp.]
MKSKTKQIDAKRVRRDYAFGRMVGVFGFLVLATFATLIFHILYNAAPLFQSPAFEFKYSIADNDAATSIGVLDINGEWVSIHSEGCSIALKPLSSLANNSADRSRKFITQCNKQVIGIVGNQQNLLATVSERGLFELYEISKKAEYGLSLRGSFSLPVDFTRFDPDSPWLVRFQDDRLFVAKHQGSDVLAFWHELTDLSAPVVQRFINVDVIAPIMKFNQVITAHKQTLSMFNKTQERLQEISLSSEVKQIDVLANSLEVIVSVNSGFHKYNVYNASGRFVIKEHFFSDFPMDFAPLTETDANAQVMQKPIAAYHLDSQHNAIVVSFNQNKLLIVNSVTGDSMTSSGLLPQFLQVYYSRGELVAVTPNGYSYYETSNLAGMTSTETLFGKNIYAGYEAPQYIWQTSMSSDYQAAKYSVVPLIMGSLKASLLALVVAIPLALGAAIYTAYFASARVRGAIKPIIEMLEAIPSVIIGFIAAVWIAPFAQQYMQGIFVVIVMLPAVILMMAVAHNYMQPIIAETELKHWQLMLNGLVFILALVMIFVLSALYFELNMFSHGDNAVHMLSTFTLSKTAVVVSVALGIAIAPTIYTLIDDALYEVPDGVKQAAFALGATPVQTLFKVVLVVALPSIISAIMLGFGRAFGETMIVLMVTGNTPIADWDLFSGLRTLTSNLAIELQEAQLDSTLYHVLFLTAAILFVFTFIINTIASLLKRKMQRNG